MLLNNSLVSVVVPVYNAENYIKNCINSLIQQTYKNIEIIIIEDCSTDNSLSICKSLVSLDSRIKLKSNYINSGYGVSRNKGIDEAKGEWIMFLDADDEFLPDSINQIIKFSETSKCDMTIAEYINIDFKKKKKMNFSNITSKAYTTKEFAKLCLSNISWSTLSYPCSKIYKKKFLDKYKIRLSKFHDGTFLLDALSKANLIGYLNKPIVFYYDRKESIQRRYRPNMLEFINEVDNRLEKYLIDNDAMDQNHNILLIDKRASLIIATILNHGLYGSYSQFSMSLNKIKSSANFKNLYNKIRYLKNLKKKMFIFFLAKNYKLLLWIIINICKFRLKLFL